MKFITFILYLKFSIFFNIVKSTRIFPFKIDVQLTSDSLISINWLVEYREKRVKFAVEVNEQNKYNWIAIGFSEDGEYDHSDLCLFQEGTLFDTWVDKRGSIETDRQQDCLLETFQEMSDGREVLIYSRKFNTSDNKDIVIEKGTMQFVIALGRTARRNIFGRFVSKKIIPNRIFKSADPAPPLPDDVQTFDVLINNATIPSKETTYWCTVVRLPSQFIYQKQHIVKYEANIAPQSKGIVHHMEVYHCEQPSKVQKWMPMYSGPCVAENLPEPIKTCRRVIGAWAMGAEPFSYPEEAGIPIGGFGYFPFVMLEMHYNNPSLKSGIIDTSGMTFYYTSQLRRYDAGILEVGLEYTDRMAIPPGQSSFSLTGYCVPECTEMGLPPNGITIFASQLHSHLTGRRLATVYVRENRILHDINRDNHYSPHWQEIRHVEPVHILPGDSLVTTCAYKTSDRKNVTLGGLAITDEMCVNYIHYYPKSNLEVCKSSVDPNALSLFFNFVNRLENKAINHENTAAGNYRQIEWTERRVEQLKRFYNLAPMSPECRKNNGELYEVQSKSPKDM